MNIEPGMMPPEPSSEDKLIADIRQSLEKNRDRLRKLKDEKDCLEDELKYHNLLAFDEKKGILSIYDKKIKDTQWEVNNMEQHITDLGGTL